VHSWNTFRARTSHERTHIYKTHHDLDLGEATTFPLIVFFMPSHGPNTQMSFCPRTPNLGVPKFSKWELLWLWKPITFSANLRLKWGLRKSSSPCRKLSKNMWHNTYTKVKQGDFWLLVVRSQISNLIFGSSFGHNLCFKYSNGSCEPILDI
jgi:hypothetical protein